MFYEAYDSYVANAIDYDELMPISCTGINTWGTFSLSLIDALDMLAIMDNQTEFGRVAQHILETANFDTNTNVSVFETNIRVVGGLISAHLFSRRMGFQIEPGWPCSGPLLRLAEIVARKLLPAFDTPTGMPYGTVNLMYGVPENETPVTCTAGVGTFIVEFGALSRLTGDPIFEQTALKALQALQKYRSKIGLLGNHINVIDGKWTATDAGIGAGVDSYFEYLVKGSIMLQMPSLIEVFYYDYSLIKTYLKKNDWYVWVSMVTGSATMPIFQSLEAFFPGLLTLVGDLDQAKKSLYNYHQVWKQYGFVPEFYDIVHEKHHKREGYPLRPEFIESVFYLYHATKDSHLFSIGADVVDSIYYSARTDCGYATIKSVSDHTIEDRMESFFLAETLKYLFLLFDEDNFINENGSHGLVHEFQLKENSSLTKKCVIESGGYVFNTEAHPIDISALSCCSNKNNLDEMTIFDTKEDDDLDLYDLFFESKSKSIQYNEKQSPSSSSLSSVDDKDDDAKINHQSIDNLNQKSSIQLIKSDNYLLIILKNETHCNIQQKILQNPFLNDHFFVDLLGIPSSIPKTALTPMMSSITNLLYSIPINHTTNVNDLTSIISIETSNIDDFLVSEIKNVSYNFNRDIDNDDDDETVSIPSIDLNYESLLCPAQSFLLRLSLYGQMFIE